MSEPVTVQDSLVATNENNDSNALLSKADDSLHSFTTTSSAGKLSLEIDNNDCGNEKDLDKVIDKETESLPLTPTETIFPTQVSGFAHDQVVSWAKTLQSPTLPSFSPSLDAQKSKHGFHGKGLQLCMDRGKQLNKTTLRCMNVLQELTALYIQFSLAIHKAGQALPTPTREMNAVALEAGLSETLPLVALQQSMLSWARDKTKLAKQVRALIAPLLQSYLTLHNETILGIEQKYKQSRTTCAYARGRALSSRHKYVKHIKDSEHLIAELKSKEQAVTPHYSTTNNGDEPHASSKVDTGDEQTSPTAATTSAVEASKNLTPTRPPKRLEVKLKENIKEARYYEDKYKLRVGWENDCVAQCVRLENMALETLQKMEEDRLSIFVNTLIKVMAAEKEVLDAGVISLARDVEKEEPQNNDANSTSSDKKNPLKLVQMFAASSFLSEEETTGAMDAETLGLPEEIGGLRDKVRARLNARKERIQLAKALSIFFENVTKAGTKLGESLLQLMKKEAVNFHETLPVAMGACEGAHVLRLWDGMGSFIEAEAQGCFAMADSLRNVRAAKLDTVILYGEKAMKVTMENDETAWKQLCETARAQSKAENKYRQSSVESARARDRVLSLDSKSQHPPDTGGNDNKAVGKRMQKGLANIVSLLPDGGDNAMKILGPRARASHAQRGQKEAEEKQAKEKQQLVSAVEAASAALTAYKNDAEHTILRYDEEEREGWQDIDTSIKNFAELTSKLLGTLQLESISDMEPIAAQSQDGMCSDINDWRMRAQQELVAICVDCTVSEDLPDAGFRLDCHLIKSTIVDEYVESTGGAIETKEVVDDVSIDEDLIDEEAENSGAKSADGALSLPPDLSKQQDDVNVRNLFRRSVLSSQLAVGSRRSNAKKLTNRERTNSDHDDPETDLFLTYFWPDPVEAKTVPMVVDSFPCSFRDGAHQLPFQYGRVYLSASRLIFVSWTKKKLNLKWDDVRDIINSKSFDARFDAALQIVCKKPESPEDSCMILDGFADREAALVVINQLREDAKAAAEALAATSPQVASGEPGGVVPPDKVIQDMKIVVSKHLRKISIERFHQIVWSEKEKAVYQPWLEKEAFDVEVSDWKECHNVGTWCKEAYQDERLIKFKIKRKTHLYIGPPIANVVQTHRCRKEGNDRCIVSMTIEFEGIPYSDTFAVEVRWVATREGAEDIKVECGLAVDFRKKTFLKSKIQSGTIEESTPVHKNFFKTMQEACAAATGVEPVEEGEEPEVEEAQSKGLSIAGFFQENQSYIHVVAIGLPLFIFAVYKLLVYFRGTTDTPSTSDFDIIIQRVDALEAKLDVLQSSMDELLQALQKSNNV